MGPLVRETDLCLEYSVLFQTVLIFYLLFYVCFNVSESIIHNYYYIWWWRISHKQNSSQRIHHLIPYVFTFSETLSCLSHCYWKVASIAYPYSNALHLLTLHRYSSFIYNESKAQWCNFRCKIILTMMNYIFVFPQIFPSSTST